MRRSGFLTLVPLAACGRRTRVPDAATARGSRAPVRIAVLGDSLALGTGASHPDGGFIFRAYRRVLAQRPGSRIDSYAIGGSMADDVERVQVGRLAGDKPDVVVVCVGGNDVVRRVPASTFADRMQRIVGRLRELVPDAHLLLCGVPDVALSPLFGGLDVRELAALASADDAAVRALAQRNRAQFFDLYAVTRRARSDAARFLSDDRFHPSDRGYAQLADAFSPVLFAAVDTVS